MTVFARKVKTTTIAQMTVVAGQVGEKEIGSFVLEDKVAVSILDAILMDGSA